MGRYAHTILTTSNAIDAKLRLAGCASSIGIDVLTSGVGVRRDSTGPLSTGAALLSARVWVLYGGDSVVSTGTGLLSAGVGVRRGVAGSLSNWVGVQFARVWVMCGGAGSWASTTLVLSASTGSTIFSEVRVVTPLDTAITLSNSNG